MLFGRNDINTEQQDEKEASTCENELGSLEVGKTLFLWTATSTSVG